MIRITDSIWIGDSGDERRTDMIKLGIGAILNVAQDLQPSRGWRSGIEYAQVGLIDGPGNPTCVYAAAVLALSALLHRYRRVLVCCHDMSRSLAVVAMRMIAVNKMEWDRCLEILAEFGCCSLPKVNDAHRLAAETRMDWDSLRNMT